MEENENKVIEQPACECGECARNKKAGKKEKEPSPFAGIKDQKGLKAKIKFFFEVLDKYPTVKQAVLFLLFSFICGATQMIITFALPAILRAISPEKMGTGTGLDFFVFFYKEPGMGEFIGFLVGSIWGQTLTFILNRKKTFNVPDHVVFRAIAYTVMAILIIIMQTAIGGGISTGFKNAFPNASDSLIFLYNLIGQLVAGIAALVVSFLGNKFFVMRQWKSKKPAVETAEGEAQAAASEAEENDKE